MLPSLDNNQNTCPGCGTHLLINQAATGTRIGQHYINVSAFTSVTLSRHYWKLSYLIQCFNSASHPDSKQYWFFFPPRATPSLPASQTIQIPSATIVSCPLLPSQAKQYCPAGSCHSSCIHKNCMCCLHCVENGGCAYKTHNMTALSDCQKGKQHAPEPVPWLISDNTNHISSPDGVIYSHTPDDHDNSQSQFINGILQDFSGPMVQYQAKCGEEQEQCDHEQRELDTALELSLSLVPVSIELDQMMADKEAELQHAMHLSLSPNINISGAPTNAAASSSISQPTSFICSSSVSNSHCQCCLKETECTNEDYTPNVWLMDVLICWQHLNVEHSHLSMLRRL